MRRARAAILLLCLRRFGHELDDMTPLDRAVRVIAARRNVDVWMFAAAVAAGHPAAGFQAVTAWEALTAAWHLPRALWLVRRGGPQRGTEPVASSPR